VRAACLVDDVTTVRNWRKRRGGKKVRLVNLFLMFTGNSSANRLTRTQSVTSANADRPTNGSHGDDVGMAFFTDFFHQCHRSFAVLHDVCLNELYRHT